MTIASDLLQRPFQTLVDDPRQWQTLIADDLDWELPYAPQSAILLGSPAGRRSSSVQDFRFFDARISAFTDPEPTVAEVQGEALIKQTGRRYRQQYVVFLQASRGKIAARREYFNPILWRMT